MEEHHPGKSSRDISLAELVRQLRLKWKYIGKLTLIAFIVGAIIAVSIPREYTCTVKMAPEGRQEGIIPGNMSGLAAMAGINIDMQGEEGLSRILYPDIIHSVPFLTELLSTQVKTMDGSEPVTLYYYIDRIQKTPWWSAVFNLPFRLLDRIRYGRNTGDEGELNPYNLTKAQEEVINKFREHVEVTVNEEKGTISAGVILQDPALTAVVADSLVRKLERYVSNYRTTKAKNDLNFAMALHGETKQKYFEAQQKYALYVDRNKNIALESVRLEQERLKNELDLAYNVYSGVAQQVEKARMKVQEQTPVITVIEPPRVPAQKSNASRLMITMGFAILGALLAALNVIRIAWEKILIQE